MEETVATKEEKDVSMAFIKMIAARMIEADTDEVELTVSHSGGTMHVTARFTIEQEGEE